MKRFIRRILLLAFVVLLVYGTYMTVSGYRLYKEATAEKSVVETVTEIRRRENYATLSEVPDLFEKGLIATEDQRFYKHKGVDLFSTFRAFLRNLRAKEFSQGGSTLTQQLAKNLFFSHEKTLERKVAELFVVYELEDTYGKDVILELYINTVYYGDGYYCIKDASNGYFRCKPMDMTDYEATRLAGVFSAPSVFAPSEDSEVTHKRHEHVLSRMVACDYITKAQKEKILSDGRQ